jgi:RING-type zinc-finger
MALRCCLKSSKEVNYSSKANIARYIKLALQFAAVCVITTCCVVRTRIACAHLEVRSNRCIYAVIHSCAFLLHMLLYFCRFHLLGTCKFGAACTYSHAAGIGVGDKRPLCPYIDKPGGCRYGASCFLRHPQSDAELAAAAALALAEQQQQQQEAAAAAVVVEDVEIGLVVYGPNGEAHRQVPKQTAARSKLSAHAPEFKFTPAAAAAPLATVVSETVTEESTAVAAAAAEPKAKAKEKADAEQCGICFDSIAACGKRFGLLTGCDHVFCLECIRTWRKSTSVEKDVSRSCPCCREHSYFVMPSKFSVTGESKVINNCFKVLCNASIM